MTSGSFRVTMTIGFLRAMRVLFAVMDPGRSPGRAMSSKYEGAKQRNVAAVTFSIALIMTVSGACVTASAQEALPLPRFVSLKADEVNMRAGPGESYPVEWVYTRKGLPVEIIKEYDQWREVRDVEGTRGWVHRVMLSGLRTVQVTGAVERTGYDRPSVDGRAVFRAHPGVQGTLIGCQSGWCRIDISGVKGWMAMGDLWGVYPEDGAGG